MQLGHTAEIGIFQCFFIFCFSFLACFCLYFCKEENACSPPSNQMLLVYNAGGGVRQIFFYIVSMTFEGLNKREIDKMDVDRLTTYPSACGGLSHSAETMAYQGTWECKVHLLLYCCNNTDYCCTFLVIY